MNRKLILVVMLLTSGCSSSGIGSMDMFKKNTARVLSGDDSQVTLYDQRGIVPAGAQATADKYCARYGKKAEWKSRGGTDSDCVSMQMDYCATYSCE